MEWSAVENGIADVLGVPEQMIERFSKRAQEIRGALADVSDRLGLDANSAKASNIAARETRAAKMAHVATADLRAGWREEAHAAGLDPERLAVALHRAAASPADTGFERMAATLTENASTFGRRDAGRPWRRTPGLACRRRRCSAGRRSC